MRLTVSSTAMMKPLLQINETNYTTQPPMRILGLLERNGDSPEQNRAWEKVVQYHRPNLQQVCLHTARWDHYLALNNSVNEMCVAVFGYEFDGENSWYHVWNGLSEKSYWVCHHDDLDYQPYAIVAMDALVTLAPLWNGQLHTTPNKHQPTNRQVDKQINYFDSGHPHTLLVSDASADADGQLWFLVTVKSASKIQASERNTSEVLSGWISQT